MTRNQPFTPQEFQTIYSQVPRLTVEVLIQLPTGIVLLKRTEESWRDLWHIPGGTVLYKEKIEDAVKRIAMEELGTAVEPHKLLGYIEYPSEEKERGFGWSVGLAFLCQPTQEIDLENWKKRGTEIFATLPEKMVQEQREFLNRQLGNSY
jgi:ADP-ribose pyrophosphatase YjhB (NUDIX family)